MSVVWITGASGDLGQGLARELREHVLCTERVDVTDREALIAQFREWVDRCGQPDAVFHAAVMVELQRTEVAPARALEVNVLGTARVIEVLHALGLRSWVCAVGSGHVYGQSRAPIREDWPKVPRSAYARSKLAAEEWALDLGSRWDIPVFVPRVFSFTAPWQRTSFAVPALASRIAAAPAGGVADVRWLGAQRDFLDVRDVARALRLAWQTGVVGAMNVCSGEARHLRDVARQFAEWHGGSPRVRESDPRPDDVESIVGDPSVFREATGFKPAISWEQTLRDVWAQHREDR